MNSRRALAVLLAFVLSGSAARAEYILFDDVNDTIDVSGQTVIGSAATFEAVVMFPSGTGGGGAIFEEHLAFGEDKQLQAGPGFLLGFAYSSTCCLQSNDPIAPDVFHHVAYVLDGAANEESPPRSRRACPPSPRRTQSSSPTSSARSPSRPGRSIGC